MSSASGTAHQYTSYDACYLALTEALEAPLYPGDAKLASAGHAQRSAPPHARADMLALRAEVDEGAARGSWGVAKPSVLLDRGDGWKEEEQGGVGDCREVRPSVGAAGTRR